MPVPEICGEAGTYEGSSKHDSTQNTFFHLSIFQPSYPYRSVEVSNSREDIYLSVEVFTAGAAPTLDCKVFIVDILFKLDFCSTLHNFKWDRCTFGEHAGSGK